jgi:hypothetical protein
MSQRSLADYCGALEKAGARIRHARLDHIIIPYKVEILLDDGTWHQYSFPSSLTTLERLQTYDRFKDERRSSVSVLRPPRS